MKQSDASRCAADASLHQISGGTGSQSAAKAIHIQSGAAAAPVLNPKSEDAYWSENYIKRDYVDRSRSYTDYGPAYQYGWEARARFGERSFQSVEGQLARGWEKAKGDSKLVWDQARHATSDAWHRITSTEAVAPKNCCS